MRDIEELRPLRALTLLTIRQSLADTDEAQRGLLGNAEVLPLVHGVTTACCASTRATR